MQVYLEEDYCELCAHWKHLSLGEISPVQNPKGRAYILRRAQKNLQLAKGELRHAYKDLIRVVSSLKPRSIGRRKSRQMIKQVVECPICLDDYNYADTFLLGCTHQFCKDCLRKTVTVRSQCPCCNRPINYIEGDRAYIVGWLSGRINVNNILMPPKRTPESSKIPVTIYESDH